MQSRSQFYIIKTPDIDKFEEKLREAEQQLGISPSNAVPVEYHNADSIGSSQLLFLLLIIGALLLLRNKNFKIPGFTDFVSISNCKLFLFRQPFY